MLNLEVVPAVPCVVYSFLWGRYPNGSSEGGGVLGSGENAPWQRADPSAKAASAVLAKSQHIIQTSAAQPGVNMPDRCTGAAAFSLPNRLNNAIRQIACHGTLVTMR